MNKSIVKLSLLGFLAAAVAAPLHLRAQDTNLPAVEKGEAKAKAKRSTLPPIHGHLKAVDTTAKTLTIGEHTIQVTSETKITKAGKPAVLTDGVTGEEVSVVYRKTADGKLDALAVRFGPNAGMSELKKEKREAKKEEMAKPQ